MVQRVATDERPFETPSSEESGLGRSDSPSQESEPEAGVVVPPDGGWGWVVVIASCMCNMIVDGIIFSGGLLSEDLEKEFNANKGEVAPVNSLLSGFYLLAGPFVSAMANKYGFRNVTIAGSIISCLTFSLSYFAKNLWYLYVIYGIIGGIGFGMIYLPAVLTVGFYFEKRRALATGIALCGSGLGVLAIAPLTTTLKNAIGWDYTFVVFGGMSLSCAVFGAMFRPLKPVRVTFEQTEEDTARRHEEAVEKLNSMLKLHSKLDSGISMPLDVKFNNKVSPHTWMGVASNTRYPTAEEVFRGSNSHLSRRSSAVAATVKANKPLFITAPVDEKDEQEESNGNIDNTEPLIGITSTVKVVPREARCRRSHADLARPMYRDDIFFGASLTRLPQYTSRTSLGYHLAVTHVPTKEDEQEERSGKCSICPEAVKRILATMLDFSLFKSPTFVIFALSGFFTMLGFFVPYAYVTARAKKSWEWNETFADYLLPVIGIANVVARIGCGIVSSMPKVSPLWLHNIALAAGGIATIFSGYSSDYIFQYGYCSVFGLAVACFASLRSILCVEYIGLERLTNCFGLFMLFQGVGALLSTPVAAALYDSTHSFDLPFYVAGGFLLLSALMLFPIDYISKWEKTRQKLNSEPKV